MVLYIAIMRIAIESPFYFIIYWAWSVYTRIYSVCNAMPCYGMLYKGIVVAELYACSGLHV